MRDAKDTLYLTFDDGPDPEATPVALDTLDAFDAKAVFFMVGERVRRHPAIVQEVLRRGHVIGNHTAHHLSGWKTKNARYFEDVASCEESLSVHKAPVGKTLFRPPYGQITPLQARTLSDRYQVVMWSLLSGDFDHKMTVGRSLAKLDNARSGDIVVFHDSVKFLPLMGAVLPEFLKRFQGKGFKFAAISGVDD